MAAPSGLNDRITQDLGYLYGTLQQTNLPMWLQLDLTMAQFKALSVVERATEGVSVTCLGQQLSIGEPSASTLVEQLVKRGYVTRVPDPEDRRRVRVTMSDSGHEMLSELRHGRRRFIAEWLAHMDQVDAEALARGLSALVEAAMLGAAMDVKADHVTTGKGNANDQT